MNPVVTVACPEIPPRPGEIMPTRTKPRGLQRPGGAQAPHLMTGRRLKPTGDSRRHGIAPALTNVGLPDSAVGESRGGRGNSTSFRDPLRILAQQQQASDPLA